MSGALDGLPIMGEQVPQGGADHSMDATPLLVNPARKRTPRTSVSGGTPPVITKTQRSQLKARFQANPYPNPEEKKALAAMTGLRIDQISRWFGNARSRYLRSPNQPVGPDTAAHQPGLAKISPKPAAGIHHSVLVQTSRAFTSNGYF
jgi:Homeodomain